MTQIEKKIEKYIATELPNCVRFNPFDKGTLIGLPEPYSIPCANDTFQEMYYWDTYFTNKGLILAGNVSQAIHNVNNLCYLCLRYGFVPNGNRTYYLNDSQPPFLSLMIDDIFKVTNDKIWLSNTVIALEAEYNFWMNKRRTNCGLNFYGCMPLSEEVIEEQSKNIIDRIGFRPENLSDRDLARGMISGGESGWDMNPRMTWETYNYLPVDLNSLLYSLEYRLAYFFKILGDEVKKEFYNDRKNMRVFLFNELLLTNEGFYNDFNQKEGKHVDIISAACFYPLYCRVATQETAEKIYSLLPKIETKFGILTCEKREKSGNYQWDSPNGWAPLQLIVAKGLLNYGYKDDALRIARNFIATMERLFDKTGKFWEKYNVLNGSIDVTNEYEMPQMMGWNFGVYTELKHWLKKR